MSKSNDEILREKRSAIAKGRNRSDTGEFKTEIVKPKVPTVANSTLLKAEKAKESSKRISDACKIECDRQKVGPTEHRYLIDAYNLILTKEWRDKKKLSLAEILTLSSMVEPEKAKGLRRTPVTFANGTSGLSPDLIPRALEALLEGQEEIPLDVFVKEFLVIHPFVDGNGRTAFLLYNLLAKNFDYPVALPDYFGK